jgi:hypothetical protein
MLVARHDDRGALLLRDRHRRDLGVEEAALLRRDGLQSRSQRHAVLCRAFNAVVRGDVLDRPG